MVGPPGVPRTSQSFPFRNTNVGHIDESIRLPGAIALASRPTTPNKFGTPGLAEKSSISLFSRNPAPRTTSPHPWLPLSVVVLETALPHRSTTEKWVVCSLSLGKVPWTTDAGSVRRSGEKSFIRDAAY